MGETGHTGDGSPADEVTSEELLQPLDRHCGAEHVIWSSSL